MNEAEILRKLYKIANQQYAILMKLCFLKYAGLKDLLEKYPQHKAAIEFLHNADPSPNKKYLNYATNVLVSGQALQNEIADVIKKFHKHHHRLENKDINSYNFTDLRDKVFSLDQEKSKTQQKKDVKISGGQKIYEDDQVIALLVKNKAGACFYGAGTKWCITMDSQSYYEQYVSGNVVFIFLLRKDLEENDPNYKVALVFQRDLENKILEIQYFDAVDIQVSENQATSGIKNWGSIKSTATTIAQNAPKGFLAILKTKPETLTLEDYKKNMNEGQSKEIIAKDVNTPPEILAMLAKDGDKVVRACVAENPNTPPEILAMLAKDGDEYVRTKCSIKYKYTTRNISNVSKRW